MVGISPIEEQKLHEIIRGMSPEQQEIAIQDFDTAVIHNEYESRVKEAMEFKQKAIDLGIVAQGMRI